MPPIGLVEAGWKRPMNLNEIYQIDQYIDTFALGHYARVLSATDLRTGHNVAFKVMRPEV